MLNQLVQILNQLLSHLDGLVQTDSPWLDRSTIKSVVYSDTFWRNLKTTNQADDETAKRTKKPSCFRHWRRTTRAIKISFLQRCLVHVNGFSTMKDFWSGGTARSREFFEFLRDLGVENLSCRDLLLMRRDSGDTFSELWDILVKSASDAEAGQIVCVLDALDECEENSRHQLIDELVGFFSRANAERPPSIALKFLVTSRPYDDVERRFQRLSKASTYLRFDGDDKPYEIGQEINLVIDPLIPSIAADFGDADRKRISARLKSMNNRTYLWLFLTIDVITRSPSKFGKASTLDSLLSNLPSDVSNAYERILSRSSDEDQARILLQIVLAATRPLGLREANIALTLANQEGSLTAYNTLDLWPQRSLRSTIKNLCGLFVSVCDGKVSLIHQTAREFLIDANISRASPSAKWQGSLSLVTAHCTIARVCVLYLSFDDFAIVSEAGLESDGNCRAWRDTSHSDARYDFLGYASLNWAIHYSSQPSNIAEDIRKAAQDLCNLSLPYQSYWFRIYENENSLPFKNWTSLGIASLFGLPDVVQSFLDDCADANTENESLSSALEIASSKGHLHVAHMLLDKGADVNVSEGAALMAASNSGHDQIVELLLDEGADANSGNGWSNALGVASSRGHQKIVQRLLERGANVNARNKFIGSALHAVSARGDQNLVRLLLKFGADVNAKGGSHGNALHAAAIKGHETVVQLLLENKADINTQFKGYRSALQAASSQGNQTVVELLVENGANVNAQGGFNSSAIQAAIVKGHAKVMHFLLDKGAYVRETLDEATKASMDL